MPPPGLGRAVESAAATRVPSSLAPPTDPPPFACRDHRRSQAPEHGRSPRPRLIDAPAENRATARASAGILNTGRVESTAAPCPGRAPSASTHSIRRAVDHSLDLGMHARPPRPAAQRDISRHVQCAPPYDGQRVVLHPMSPFGLTRTGRAPSLNVV